MAFPFCIAGVGNKARVSVIPTTSLVCSSGRISRGWFSCLVRIRLHSLDSFRSTMCLPWPRQIRSSTGSNATTEPTWCSTAFG